MRRLLIIGCGDVALRALPLLRERYRVYALTHSRERAPLLRAHGVLPIAGDLDDPASLDALTGIAHDVLHSAPPPSHGVRDTRTAHLIAALAKGKSLPQHLIYISTTGVYGDCAGALVDETRPLRPQTARARRRVDAERQLRDWGRRSRVRISVLRAPGIYSGERLPLERLHTGMPALKPDEDSYSNHVHADDLARMVVAALRFGHAGHCGLPRPPRLSRAEASRRIPANVLSFMNESRRLSNRRLKDELRFQLRYPTVRDGIAAIAPVRAIER